MANLTVTIEEDVLRRARIRALELGTSVNRLLADYLRAFATDEQVQATAEFLRLSDRDDAGSGPGGRRWTRDELYERGR